MGQKFAAYDASGAIITYYDSVDSPVPNGVEAIEISDTQWQACITSSGWTIVQEKLVAPVPPTDAQVAEQTLIQSAYAAMLAGLKIASSSSPALNGTYAVDQLSQMDIIAIETSLSAGKGFPGGVATFSYLDVTGTMRPFSESNFMNFAAAVRDYVYALKSVTAGVLTTLPASSVMIA